MERPCADPTRLEIRELERIASCLIKYNIADSTRRSYATGQSTYISFCVKFSFKPLPASEQQLILFAADLSHRLSSSTVRSYLSAIRFLHVSSGHGDPLAGRLQLDLLSRGIRKSKPAGKDNRLPVTPLVLEKMYGILNRNPSECESKLLWAACCLGFFGFLRSGEFTAPSRGYDPPWHLSVQDIAVDSTTNPTWLQITINGSKTDQLRQGVNIVVGRTSSHICPVNSVLAYVACRGFGQGPLFRHKDGSPLTREQLVSGMRETLLAAGVEYHRFSGHSFWIGAATAAAARGVADSTIQTLGRWNSESFRHYIRMPKSELASYSGKLVS